ncbi:cytochrome b561 and DOMON domain-containing protein At3g25290 [Vigna radiata var. radiata]|uniref:Cytochrome b561 and DOMON domain-containing protein n=1 Tax=Vigna radiata var. radiata TaxID=3916 RepID=A0A1S3UD29_VIGRR|nr:cytochrome b561 and DOMON domain-containing protein At3g25290 [Vigna radiata var. radiata]
MKTQQQSMPSSPLLPLTILTLTLLSLTLAANAQDCTEAFLKLAQQKNISDCKRLRTLGAEFAWKLHANSSHNSTLVDILFGATLNAPQGWIGWGVNPGRRPEMVGAKAIIAVKRSDGTWLMGTYNITKEIRNGCNLLPSEIGIVLDKSVEQEVDNLHTMHVRLNLSSHAYNVTRLNHIWQVGYDIEGGRPLGHPKTLRNVDSTEVIDLTDSNGRSTGQYRSYLRTIHGVLNIIGWGTLLPIGIIIARYFRVFPFKYDPLWFNLHIGCQLTGFLVGTTGWAIGLSLGHSSRYYTFRDHRTYGILIFTFSTIQMLAFRLKPKLTDDYRKYWNMYHHFLGYGLLAIIFINIFKGIRILEGGDAWKWGYVADLAFLGAIAFGLEVYTWIHFFGLKQKEKQKQLEEAIKPKSTPHYQI